MSEGLTAIGGVAQGHMDIRQNVETWHRFVKLTLGVTGAVIIIVALLGLFLAP